MDDQLPARFRAYSAPETSEWFPRRPGFQSGCDRDSPGSLASPLISAWQVVGCDHHLDSLKQEDKCLQCGGDGTTCYPVTGVFEANDLSRGGGSSWGLQTVQTGVCRLPLPGVLLAGAALRRCDLVLRS